MAEKTLLTKEDLVAELVSKNKMTKTDASHAVDIVFSSIAEGLLSGKVAGVRISGFGTFEVAERKERTGVNPSDPSKKITIPASKVVKFKASKTLKDLVKSN